MSGEIISSSKESIIVNNNCGKTLSLNRETPHVDFKAALAKFVQYIDMSHVISTIEKTSQYVVTVPVEYQDALKEGLVELNQNAKNGKIWPTLVKRLENGKKEIVANLPVHEETFVQGNPMHDLSSGMQNLFLQQKLEEITQLVRNTYEAVLRIEQGQMDDRIGLLRSGFEGVELAMLHSGEQKERELEHAREQIREAKNRLGEVLKSRINSFKKISSVAILRIAQTIVNSSYEQQKDEEYNRIQDLFELYMESVALLASSYTVVHDTEAAKKVYDNARSFIESLDYEGIRTIAHIHKNVPADEYVFNKALKTVKADETRCLEASKPYAYVELSFRGEEILEACEDGTEQ